VKCRVGPLWQVRRAAVGISRPIRAPARARLMGSYSGGIVPSAGASCGYPRTPASVRTAACERHISAPLPAKCHDVVLAKVVLTPRLGVTLGRGFHHDKHRSRGQSRYGSAKAARISALFSGVQVVQFAVVRLNRRWAAYSAVLQAAPWTATETAALRLPTHETDQLAEGSLQASGGFQLLACPIQSTSWPSVPDSKISRPGLPPRLW
jgi:hypothetical protein